MCLRFMALFLIIQAQSINAYKNWLSNSFAKILSSCRAAFMSTEWMEPDGAHTHTHKQNIGTGGCKQNACHYYKLAYHPPWCVPMLLHVARFFFSHVAPTKSCNCLLLSLGNFHQLVLAGQLLLIAKQCLQQPAHETNCPDPCAELDDFRFAWPGKSMKKP